MDRCCYGQSDWLSLRMGTMYSAYDAKTRFSEVLRKVRDGKTVTVSYRGKPVAEIRAIRESPEMIEARLDHLERQGILVRSGEPRRLMKAVVRRPGALARFLAERG